MNLRRLSTGVGTFVQRTIRKAGLPWKIVKFRNSASFQPNLLKSTSGLLQPNNDVPDGDSPRLDDIDHKVPSSVPESQSGSKGCPVQIESLRTSESQQTVNELSPNDELDGVPEYQSGSNIPSVHTERLVSLDDSPYTEGPSRLVIASDGIKDCLAILLNRRMVAEVNEINEARYKLEVMEEKFDKLQRQITSNEMFLEQADDTIQNTATEEEGIWIIKEVEER